MRLPWGRLSDQSADLFVKDAHGVCDCDGIISLHATGTAMREGGRFVVHQHNSRSPHYDFRLEREGVFKSWAIPKGIPDTPGIRRLAIQVDDHPLYFGDFEGVIPPGQYGAGTIEIWDSGIYDVHEWLDDRLAFTLHGARCNGIYNLVRFHRKGDREWLLFKRNQQDRPGMADSSESGLSA